MVAGGGGEGGVWQVTTSYKGFLTHTHVHGGGGGSGSQFWSKNLSRSRTYHHHGDGKCYEIQHYCVIKGPLKLIYVYNGIREK